LAIRVVGRWNRVCIRRKGDRNRSGIGQATDLPPAMPRRWAFFRRPLARMCKAGKPDFDNPAKAWPGCTGLDGRCLGRRASPARGDFRGRGRSPIDQLPLRQPFLRDPGLGRIQALRERNTVDAAPERVARKAARAERPVTARIRERRAEVPAVVPVEEAAPVPVKEAQPEPAPAAREPTAASRVSVIAMPDPIRSVNGHSKAVIRRRQGSEVQLRLF
jgi:hypothetical protein